MGWCGGTDIFDAVFEKIQDLPEEKMEEIVTALYAALCENDWDCEGESRYFDEPVFYYVRKKLYPEFWTDED